ncbi:MAG: efflux RND transporter periplasmic adaptor subunit [Candidatus Protochlamydia sp.]|nr:efflux RND transporter periplasmic adaptor subunit [Candidatus Protochlamydia sp.]
MLKFFLGAGFIAVLSLIAFWQWQPAPLIHSVPLAPAERRHLIVDIKTVGELEAARSTIIASSIKGDLGKIIDLIPDGITVVPGQVLVKMDPTPFEEKLHKLQTLIKEQEAHLITSQQTLQWEESQAEHENKTAVYEVETAEMEIEKIIRGDGPQETSRLKGALQKAWLKYEELNSYSNDLMALQEQGFLNPTELRQAQKKLDEEKEAYEVSKLQHDSYVNHVYPMLIKKAETNYKRAKIKQEETFKTGLYKIAKAKAYLSQANQLLEDFHSQLEEGSKELEETQILAPAPGMVVHREEYRSGQKRKPRIGDILVRNQALMDLPDLSSMVVKTRVREIDLFKIEAGKKATIEVDAYPHLNLRGTISSIGILALADIGRLTEEKYFEVRIALNDVDHRLRPGMTTRVTLHAQSEENALSVPLHAVFGEKRNYYCYVHTKPGYEKRFVRTGISNEQWMQVIEGIQEGEEVCLLVPRKTK